MIGSVRICSTCATAANTGVGTIVRICAYGACWQLIDSRGGNHHCASHGGSSALTLALPAGLAAPANTAALAAPAPAKKTKARRARERVTRYQVKILPSGAWAGVIDGSVHAVTSSQAIRFLTAQQAEDWGEQHSKVKQGALRGRAFVVEPVLVDEEV